MSFVPFSNVYVDVLRPARNASTGATGGAANMTVLASDLRCRLGQLTTQDWQMLSTDISARAETVRRKMYKLRVPSGMDIAEGDVVQNIRLLNKRQYWPGMQNVADGTPPNVTARVRFVRESDAGPLGVRTAYVDVNVTGGPMSPLR